jgi:uncharacterized membrane-anchored protein YhcB (DUF1043 family)
MEYGIYAFIALAFAAIGFVTGVLVGRNNPGDVTRVINNVKAEIERNQSNIDKAKAELLKLGIKV